MVEIGDKLFLKCKFHAANERRLSMHWGKDKVFFFWFIWGRVGQGVGDFYLLSILNVFLSISQWVSQVPPDFPNSTLIWSHIFWTQVQLSLYIICKGAPARSMFLFWAVRTKWPRPWNRGIPNVPEKLVMHQSRGPLKIYKSVEALMTNKRGNNKLICKVILILGLTSIPQST